MKVDRKFPVSRISESNGQSVRQDNGMWWSGPGTGPSTTIWITVALGIATILIVAWWWQRQIEVRSIEFKDVKFANLTELRSLVPVETGVMMKDVDVSAVTDSVASHPWVKAVETSTLFNGTVEVRITEREPVMLVLASNGRPYYYVDEDGYQMPVVENAMFDVPIVRGSIPGITDEFRLTRAVLRELAHALVAVPVDVNALFSEFTLNRNGTLRAMTIPGPGGKPFEVRLGRSGFEGRMVKLRDFWDQAILPQPDKSFQYIDLRFDGQIITRETNTSP